MFECALGEKAHCIPPGKVFTRFRRSYGSRDQHSTVGKTMGIGIPTLLLHWTAHAIIPSSATYVVPVQEKFIKFKEDSRYAPLKLKQDPLGFVMLRDMTPSEAVELVSADTPVSAVASGAAALAV